MKTKEKNTLDSLNKKLINACRNDNLAQVTWAINNGATEVIEAYIAALCCGNIKISYAIKEIVETIMAKAYEFKIQKKK
jgi:hypothetical protein